MALADINLPLISRYIGTLKTLVSEPVGLYMKSRTHLYSNLVRNAGGLYDYGYDSWGTSIGDLAIPDYVSRVGNATYLNDNVRDAYPNYVNYVRETYGDSIGLNNINNGVYAESDPYKNTKLDVLSVTNSKIQRIVGYKGGISSVIHNLSPNYSLEDTIMGKVSAMKLGDNLSQATVANNERMTSGHFISKNMSGQFGMTDSAYQGNSGLGFKVKNGFSDDLENDFAINGTTVSPVYGFDYAYDLEYYGSGVNNMSYLDTLSDFQKKYVNRNISGLKYELTEGETYIDKFGFTTHYWDDYRFVFNTDNGVNVTHNINGGEGNVISVAYGEKDGKDATAPDAGITYDVGVTSRFSKYDFFGGRDTLTGILKYTNEMFRNGKYKTLVSRFHGDTVNADDTLKNDPTQSAVSQFGVSHGRNLLKKNKTTDGSYDNPYCRVWTNHHQYHRLADLIRPLSESTNNTSKVVSPYMLDTEDNYLRFRSPDTGMDGGSGGGRLTKHGVINYNVNGLVNITPVNDGKDKHKVDIKNCMFSIENLAWKGAFSNTGGANGTSQNMGLSKEQKGPFGGRIMWFPPYGLSINEVTDANWEGTDFIGRGEKIFTYSNTNRTGNLNFMLLIDHPSVINYWRAKKDEHKSGVDDVDSSEQQLLRFFAGCDRLTADAPLEPKKPKMPEVKENNAEPLPETKTMTFFVFFPNNYTGNDDDPSTAMTYLMNGVGAGKTGDTNNNRADYITINKLYTSNKVQVGGYEVRQSTVSVRTTKLNSSSGFIGAVFTNPNNLSTTRKPLYIISGKGTSDFSSADWYKAKWAYRVDTDPNFVIDEVLHSPEHYIDTRSYFLNSGGEKDVIKKTFNISSNNKMFAATDVFVALEGKTAQETLYKWYDAANVKEFLNTIKPNITSIECNGWASSNGTIEKNMKLANRRAKMVSSWLRSKLNSNVDIKAKTSMVKDGPSVSDISGLDQKMFRCVKVDVYYQVSKAITSQNTVKVDENTSIKVNPFNTTPFIGIQANKVEGANTTLNNQAEATKLQRDVENLSTNIKVHYYGENSQSNALSGAKIKTDADLDEVSGVDIAEDETLDRYDDEGTFFSLLETNDPFMHHKITDKIKYFDPAFHSISPEGFNARLTFLQQCMRQGPTVGGSDVYAGVNTANNLSFGRPPVCILRLGDFYYTKIIINNINIEYDPLVWDLNTEGIGVMPMIAKVSMNFNFIGGSSITGPVSRLQNALSFNMYANTEVYDNRAEQVDFDDNGEIKKFKAFVPK